MPKASEELKKLSAMWGGFRQAKVLLTANNLEFFENFKAPLTAEGLSKKIGSDLHGTRIVLDALTGMGLLRKKKGIYENSSLSKKFLLRESPYYQGDMLRHAENLWQGWSNLDNILKPGSVRPGGRDYGAFIRAMHNNAVLRVNPVLKAIGLRGVKTALDLGGGPGTYAIEMAKKGIDVALFDRPEAVAIAKEMAEKAGVKLRYKSGDFMRDDFCGGFDLIFISQIFHAYPVEDCIDVLKRSKDCLLPKGRVVIQEFFIKDDMTSPLNAALFSVNMFVGPRHGRCYAPSELKKWLKDTGYKGISEKRLGDTVLVSGRL